MAFCLFRFFFLSIGQELLVAKRGLHSCLTHTNLTSIFNGIFFIVQCTINGQQDSRCGSCSVHKQMVEKQAPWSLKLEQQKMMIIYGAAVLKGIMYNYYKKLQGLQQQKSWRRQGSSVAVHFVQMAT
jgi:hypothetical protein